MSKKKQLARQHTEPQKMRKPHRLEGVVQNLGIKEPKKPKKNES